MADLTKKAKEVEFLIKNMPEKDNEAEQVRRVRLEEREA